MDVEYIDHMGTDETVARAARVSTGRDRLEQGKIEGLIGYLVREKHHSTLEHCTLTVRIHVPVFVHRQIMTHRTLSKNSESGRYKELEPVFYVPSADRPLVNAGSGAHPDLQPSQCGDLHIAAREVHEKVAKLCWGAYQDFLDEDWYGESVATEVARNVLPVSIYTSAYLTSNLLGWFNFLRLRNGSTGHPQYEIVEVAKKVEAIIGGLYPITYRAWRKAQ